MRENVEKEAAQKLLGCYGHQLLFAAMGVILPAERHLIIREVYDPVIRDGDTMCVPSQVMKNVQRTAERRLRVHDPVLAEERTKKRTEGPFLRKWLKSSWKGQLSFSKSSLQPCRELSSENTTEHFHGEKECVRLATTLGPFRQFN